MEELCLTFYPALRVALVVFDSPRAGQTYDGTLRQLVDGLPTGHAPHVEGQSILGCLLSLQGHLDNQIVIFLQILSSYISYLGRHDSLSLLDEVTLGTLAVSVLAGSLVSLQPGDDPVVPTPGTLWSPQRVLAVHPEELRGTVSWRGNTGGSSQPHIGPRLARPLIGRQDGASSDWLPGAAGVTEMCYDRSTAG